MHGVQEGHKINVGVLGATGTVGQRFIVLLAEHPYFVIHAIGASPRSAGKAYSKVVTWKQTKSIPAVVRDMVVHECKPEFFTGCAVVYVAEVTVLVEWGATLVECEAEVLTGAAIAIREMTSARGFL